MTDKQINEAIAEACGWVPDCDGGICWDQYGAPLITPPNYCNDLNAMHEAEKIMTKAQWEDFVEHLTTNFYSVSDAWKDACHATARQRAEALLRTLGKWEEVQK